MNVKDLYDIKILTSFFPVPAEIREEKIDGVIVSELMSDVLTIDHDNLLLITSLCSEQALTTAHIIGAVAVIISSGKEVSPRIIALARESEIALFTTSLRNFDISVFLCSLHPEIQRQVDNG
ncbi:MAG: hypothetical protein ACQEQ4_08155 [Fibrobacterota bacterium]